MNEDTAPLSPNQEPIWFFDQLMDGDASFNMAHAYRLTGQVRAAALETALNQVVARHDSLRTTFARADGELVQRVRPQLRLRVDHIDVRGHADAQARAHAAVARHTNRPFDLKAGPLLRAALIAISPDEHILALAIHHIVADGWSLGVLWRELATWYAAGVTGRPVTLPPLPVQYPQHARTQRELAATADESLAFWREQLAGAQPLTLAADRVRTPVRTPHGGVCYRVFDNDLLAQIDQCARAARCTRFMVLTAAFQALLGVYSGQRDICLGSQVAGRSDEDLEPMIGMFTHTVALRGNLADNPTFTEHLRRTRRVVLQAMAHPHVPYERLLGELSIARDPGRGAFFDVMFLMQEFGAREPQLPGLTVSLVDPQLALAKLDLIAEAWQVPEGLQLSFGYRTDLFDESSMSRMTEHYACLLRAVANDPDARLGDLSLLSPHEERLLDRWAKDLPARGAAGDGKPGGARQDIAATVLTHVEATARQNGDQVAIRHGRQELRYAELDAAAEELATRLRSHGVRPGSVVAVQCGRSSDMVTALLAVWKARAAYLPLDLDSSSERSRFMIEDSGATLLLSRRVDSESPAVRRPTDLPTPVMHVDSACDGTGCADEGTGCGKRVHRPCGSDPAWSDLAYVIYTSGSTGRPKGVAVSHGALAARVDWMRQRYEITAADQVLQFATLSFDTHVEELYPCLTAGATLVLPGGSDASLPEFAEFLASEDADGLTVLDLPTPYWHELVNAERLALPATLRLLILGADQVSAGALARWRERVGSRSGPPIQVLNTYGPTEATVVATCAQLCPDDADVASTDGHGAGSRAGVTTSRPLPLARPPIGRPAAQTSCHVVDQRLRRVPMGVPGELVIGGAGLAWGYHGSPAMTAACFVPDPYGAPGDRLYRTGDRARWRADGELEFLGRQDDQVKIRGYRIEPAEVQAALLRDARVQQAAVVTREDEPGDRRLVGYLVLEPWVTDPATTAPAPAAADQATAATAVIDEINRALERRLPHYLRPSALVPLERLPLTRSGKLDRNTLPRPHRHDLTAARNVAPRTDAETLVAQVWADVLGLDVVGAHDDFFGLGGHSLLAATVVGRLSATIGVEVPLRAMFTERTVAGLAASIEQLLIADIAALSEQDAARLLSERDASQPPSAREPRGLSADGRRNR